jgi:MFS family permease
MPTSPELSNTTASADGEEGSHQGHGGLQALRSFLSFPRDVYLLLFYTLGKGIQLTIATLNINYYAHSLGYRPDFIGLLSALPAIGSLLSAIPSGLLADRLGRKPVLLASALLAPLFLAGIGLTSFAPLLLLSAFLQGVFSSAYWVTNIPLLVEHTSEERRVGVLALNSFLLLGIGALGNLLGGAIPQLVSSLLHVPANSVVPLRWGVLSASLITLIFGLPLWRLHEPQGRRTRASQQSRAPLHSREKPPLWLFTQLLAPDLIFNIGEGAVIALMQLFFVLRFQLMPGPLGVVFTISGLAGGVFSLAAPLFVHRWSKLRIITTVMYLSAPLMLVIGYAPLLILAIVGEYLRSFLRALIDPVYSAFAMEQVSERYRGTISGFYSVSWSIGFSVGPAIAGWLQTNVSLSSAFLFGAICLLICPSLLLLAFGRRTSNPRVDQAVRPGTAHRQQRASARESEASAPGGE